MPDYRRAWHPDGTYFFTINLLLQRSHRYNPPSHFYWNAIVSDRLAVLPQYLMPKQALTVLAGKFAS